MNGVSDTQISQNLRSGIHQKIKARQPLIRINSERFEGFLIWLVFIGFWGLTIGFLGTSALLRNIGLIILISAIGFLIALIWLSEWFWWIDIQGHNFSHEASGQVRRGTRQIPSLVSMLGLNEDPNNEVLMSCCQITRDSGRYYCQCGRVVVFST